MGKVRDFFSVFSRKKIDGVDKRIESAQKEESARLRKALKNAKDFAMNK